jgi:hypothetical protein
MQFSLRRHDPDQVLRVERETLLSARKTDSPFDCCRKEYKRMDTHCQVKNSGQTVFVCPG